MPNRIDSLISEGAAKAKGLKARFEGLKGIFRTLAEQHGKVLALMERVKGNSDKRSELWPTIRMELLSHERAEVRELFPVLRQRPATAQLADHHDKEAQELEQLIARIEATPLTSDTWGTLFDTLVDTVKRHAKEEENDMFPKAQEELGEEQVVALDQAFLRTKKQIESAV